MSTVTSCSASAATHRSVYAAGARPSIGPLGRPEGGSRRRLLEIGATTTRCFSQQEKDSTSFKFVVGGVSTVTPCAATAATHRSACAPLGWPERRDSRGYKLGYKSGYKALRRVIRGATRGPSGYKFGARGTPNLYPVNFLITPLITRFS